MRRAIVVSGAVFLGLCCLLFTVAGLGYYFLWPRAVARPVVLIRSPRYGEQIEVGETVTAHSIARDEGKVVRVEFWADGQLQETQTSTLPGGTSPFPLLADWQPPSPGTHTLIVRAFNAQGGRANASINVEAMELADRDGDRVADDVDLCPDEPGPAAADGCPDRDGDGIADAEDACPDQAGLPEADGCPMSSEGDGDGDGLLDYADACPDEPGSPRAEGCPDADGDGVADAEDACPAERGWPEHDGCPTPGDLDGDGVPDAEDACPGEPGPAEHGGCPDFDGDGVRDGDDDCPDMWGPSEHHGCPDSDGDGVPDRDDLRPDDPGRPEAGGAPDTGAGDSDGDGILDDVDPCPEDWGTLEDHGCPPAGDEEPPDDPLGGLDLGGLLGGAEILRVPVEFEALEFEVSGDYDEVYCYAGLAGEDMDRYGPFEPLGEREWDIVEYLGGGNSRHLAVPQGEPLEVQVECGATAGILGRQYPVDLGSFIRSHDPSEWDGDITVLSDPGPEGDSFQVKYRICADSCEEAAFPAPILSLFHVGGDARLIWIWGGDRESIDGFKLYINDNYVFDLPADRYSHSVRHFEPPCGGERREFQMTAYSGLDSVHPDRESPRSNTAYWTGPPCPRTIRVIFDGHTLFTYDLCCESSPVGPITGVMWANEQQLIFDGSNLTWHGGVYGLRLHSHHEYSIEEDILDWIGRRTDSCLGDGCPTYMVPLHYLTFPYDPDEGLTFGVRIYDVDSEWDWGWQETLEVACEAEATIPAGDLPEIFVDEEGVWIYSTLTASGNNCDLTVEIGLSGPTY